MLQKHFTRCLGLVICISIIGCSSEPELEQNVNDVPEPCSSLAKSERKYRNVGDDLYRSKEGLIYHRTIDMSLAESSEYSDGEYAYRGSVFVDTVIDGEETYVIAPIYKRIDTLTFHKLPERADYPGYHFYEDKNYSYFYREVSDGGTLIAQRKK